MLQVNTQALTCYARSWVQPAKITRYSHALDINIPTRLKA